MITINATPRSSGNFLQLPHTLNWRVDGVVRKSDWLGIRRNVHPYASRASDYVNPPSTAYASPRTRRTVYCPDGDDTTTFDDDDARKSPRRGRNYCHKLHPDGLTTHHIDIDADRTRTRCAYPLKTSNMSNNLTSAAISGLQVPRCTKPTTGTTTLCRTTATTTAVGENILWWRAIAGQVAGIV